MYIVYIYCIYNEKEYNVHMINISKKQWHALPPPINTGNKEVYIGLGSPYKRRNISGCCWVGCCCNSSQPKDFMFHFWLVEIIQNWLNSAEHWASLYMHLYIQNMSKLYNAWPIPEAQVLQGLLLLLPKSYQQWHVGCQHQNIVCHGCNCTSTM